MVWLAEAGFGWFFRVRKALEKVARTWPGRSLFKKRAFYFFEMEETGMCLNGEGIELTERGGLII